MSNAEAFSHPAAAPRVLHLDGLRGLAIGAVLVAHFVVPLFGNIPASPGAYVGATLTLAYTGVDLFFVLSGYLIGGILLDHRNSPRLFATFYLRRSARILPLAFVCAVLVLIAQSAGLYGPPDGGRPWSPAVYLLFAVNFAMAACGDWGYRPLSSYWSLAIEEQFYLVSPWLMRIVPPRRTLWLLLAFIIIAPVTRLALLGVGVNALAASVLPFCRTDSLGLGLLVAWIVRKEVPRRWCTECRAYLITLCLVSLLGCMLLTKLRAGNGSIPMAAGGYSVVACFYATTLLLAETRPTSLLVRILATRPLVLLGRWSYFIYLFQGLVLGLAAGIVFHHQFAIITPATWPQLALGLAILAALAAASAQWFESPILRRARRFAY